MKRFLLLLSGIGCALICIAPAAHRISAQAASARVTPVAPPAAAEKVTYSNGIAAILYANCSTCHHPNGAGPFSLLTYGEAKRWGPQILTVTQSRFMPPWLPAPGYGDFAGVRRLSAKEMDMIKDWVHAGMPAGDLEQAPPAPHYSGAWQLGKPDLILTVSQPFTVRASGSDLFHNFILPYPLKETHYIRALQILPGGTTAVVHHANVLIDRTASLRRQHPGTWEKGVPGMELNIGTGSTFDPDSHFLFWKPDTPALVEPKDMPWRLDPGNDLILNMHLKPTGKPETVQARIGLYFTNTPPSKHPMLLELEHDSALDIPAGARHFVIEDQLRLPIAVEVLGVYPHAHYLGKDLEGWAELPDGQKKWLIWIRDWDIDRQSVYRYRQPILLPKGSVLHMRYTYDNSANNPRNPNDPPIRVKAGNRSVDEMGHLWLQVLPLHPIIDGKDARLILERAWMEALLEKNENDRLALYNLAALDTKDGEVAAAIPLYKRLLQPSPEDARAWTGLGDAYEQAGKREEAEQAYGKAIDFGDSADRNNALFDLASMMLAENRNAEAAALFRRVLSNSPNDAEAHSGLGVALIRQNDGGGAEAEFQQALQLDASDFTALENLGALTLQGGDAGGAAKLLEKAVAVKDDVDARQQLALAYAKLGRMADVVEQLRAALHQQPGDATLHTALSQVYSTMGERPQAIREERTALRLQPKDADGWNNLGVLEALDGDAAAARRCWRQALRINPNDAQAQANLQRLDTSQDANHSAVPPHP